MRETYGWTIDEPDRHGIKRRHLVALADSLRRESPVSSLTIVRNGVLIWNCSLDSEADNAPRPLFSITKSVLSALVGVALRKGIIGGVDESVGSLVSESPWRLPGEEVRWRDLLTMSSGLVCQERSLSKGADVEQLTVSTTRGRFFYSDLQARLVAVALTAACNRKLSDFAREYLFGPLSVDSSTVVWRDDHGYTDGGSNLVLRPPDLAKLGCLYLNEGWWNGRRLIPEEWIAASTRPQISGGPPCECEYGYLWWVTELCGYKSYFAAGKWGQAMYVLPGLNLVVVVTASPSSKQDDWLPKLQRRLIDIAA